ncbi:unnamed protein product [Urochloa humidicola]
MEAIRSQDSSSRRWPGSGTPLVAASAAASSSPKTVAEILLASTRVPPHPMQPCRRWPCRASSSHGGDGCPRVDHGDCARLRWSSSVRPRRQPRPASLTTPDWRPAGAYRLDP